MRRICRVDFINCLCYFQCWIAIVLIVLLTAFINVSDTSAYTETITTSGDILIDVAPVGYNASLATNYLSIVSTCPGGYSVSVAGPSDNTLYKDGNRQSSDSIQATSGTIDNPESILDDNLGTWGFSINDSATIFSDFTGLSNIQTTISTKSAASAAEGDIIPVYYGVSVDSYTTPGSYTLAESSQGANDNVITYYLVPSISCAGFDVRYDDNGANSPTNMSISHEVSLGDELTFVASNYQRPGYGFAGWSTVPLDPESVTFQSDLAAAVNDGNVFGPNETITIDSGFANQAVFLNNQYSVIMYAIWVKPVQGSTLQNWSSCSSLNMGQVIALADSRDNNVYTVAKLADGNCWMIENLRLNAANSTDNTKAQGFGGVFTGLANPESANFYINTTSNSKYSTTNITGNNQGARFPRYNNTNTANPLNDLSNNDVSTIQVDDVDVPIENVSIYHYGNYYSWPAALANTSDLISHAASESANTSICPTGWMLPYGNNTDHGNTSGGFYYLNYKINNDTNLTDATASVNLRTFPNNFLLAGGIDDDWLMRGNGGSYWSSSVDDNSPHNARGLNFDFGGVRPGTYSLDRGIGASIRCLQSKSFTVSFNANGGSGTMNEQLIMLDTPTALASNSFIAPAGKIFIGWNTAANGSGTSYDEEEIVTNLAVSGGNIVLYAQWRAKLYDTIAAMTKGTQTAANLQAAITSANSGVYTYNSSVFGASTDANNDYPIYYYRGILDNTVGTYGSDGDAALYPNYVKLDNLCWRIIRTTGSGGIKMIYNGVWSGSTCANAQATSQISSPVSTSRYNATATGNQARQIVRVGYTHNNSYANTNSNSSTAFATVFGSNTNYTVNGSSSTIKDNVESWFNNNLSSLSGMLEPDAGYCNDRYSYTTSTGNTATSNIRPYTTSNNSGNTYVAYFASYQRNATTARSPSLRCSESRNVVDVYSTSTSSTGNKRLSSPIGLLTADESSFAGSGSNVATNGSSYSANSFLNTGSDFWMMSPYNRTGSYAYVFYLNSNGYLQHGRVDSAYGIRPVVSLINATLINSGEGTATNPWTIIVNTP